MNGPLVFFHEAPAHPQTQACALLAFGRVEGSKKILANPAGIPLPLSTMVTRTPFREGRLPGSIREHACQFATRRHRVDGVADQVGEYLAKLAGKPSHWRMSFETLLYPDMVLAYLRREQVRTLSRTSVRSTSIGERASRWNVSSWLVI